MVSHSGGQLARGLIGWASPSLSPASSPPFLHPCTTVMDGSHFLPQVKGPGMCVIIHKDITFIYSP